MIVEWGEGLMILKQDKISRMCLLINNGGEKFASHINYAADNMVDWFNRNWISSFSKEVSSLTRDSLDTLVREVTNLFNDFNNNVKRKVIKYNSVKGKYIYFKGISISRPNLNRMDSLNSFLPSGKVGFEIPKDDLFYPFNVLRNQMAEAIDYLKVAIVQADALNYNEQSSLQVNLLNIKRNFELKIEDILELIRKRVY